MSRFRIPLKAVLYKEGQVWLAHCLELDLIGDGENRADALKHLSEAIIVQITASVSHDCMDSLFTPAEGRFWRMFAQGKNVAQGKLELLAKDAISDNIEIEDVQAREYSEPDVHESKLLSC